MGETGSNVQFCLSGSGWLHPSPASEASVGRVASEASRLGVPGIGNQ